MVIAIVAGPWFASKTASPLFLVFLAASDPCIFSWSEIEPVRSAGRQTFRSPQRGCNTRSHPEHGS
jgi:hypothetical protein